MSTKFRRRRLGSTVIGILCLLFAALPPNATAQNKPQLKRPQETYEEKIPEAKKPKKNLKGPRAVGLLQITNGSKRTLIPVAILIDGRFHDASVYKADPVPMALESGTVYEAEQTGDSLGLFTVSRALHSNAKNSPHPWLGTGSYLPQGAEAAKSTRKAEDVPVGIESSGDSDARPRLTRGKSSKPAESSSPAPTTAPSPTGGPSSSDKPATAPASDKPADSSGKQPAPAPQSPGQSSSGQASPAPTAQGQESQAQAAKDQAAKDQTTKDQAAKDQTTKGQEQENYYRPTLRRGKPTQSAPQEEDELAQTDQSKADESKADQSRTGKPESAASSAATVQLVPAISDAGGPDPRSYKFFWKTGEEEERRNQMLALAAGEVQAYASALAKNRIPAKPPAPAKTTRGGRKPAAKPPQPEFENIQFRTFDVWGNDQPVMILSAEAHLPPAPGADAAPEEYSITLVARTDIYGNLRKLYSGVTDKFHLDVTPRLELIDAVDADGDGRGELLFRETTDAGSGYIIYRATADKLFKMFDSLAE